MSHVTRNQPAGAPTWIDLGIPDLDHAMQFFGALFGWEFDVGPPTGPPPTTGSSGADAIAGGQDRAVPTGIELSEHELREIAGYAADCARRVLSIFEQAVVDDPRPREAIAAADGFTAGGRRTGALRQSAWAAYRAAHETASPAAVDAARAASHAAAAAYLHPLADAHQVKHVLGAAAHAARAEELACEGDRAAAETLAPSLRPERRRGGGPARDRAT